MTVTWLDLDLPDMSPKRSKNILVVLSNIHRIHAQSGKSHKKIVIVVVLIPQNEHALRHVYALSNLCEENIEAEV